MANLRDRVNAHLPVILQLLSTTSLIIIALSALCGTKSLKKLAESHTSNPGVIHEIHKSHNSN